MKNLKKGCAVALSLAMSVQFGLADSYYLNALADETSVSQEEVNTVSDEENTEESSSIGSEEQTLVEKTQPENESASVNQDDETVESAPTVEGVHEVTKDYSNSIVFNQSTDVTYNVDQTVATVTMRVDTTDNVSLDFSNASDVIVNNEYVSIDNSKTTSDQKTWALNITKNGTYTFNAIVVDNETLKTVGSKDITVSVTGIEEKKEETSNTESKKESEVKTVEENASQIKELYLVAKKSLITVGESTDVTAHFDDAYTGDKSVTWSTSNADVATVDNGTVTAVGKGTVTITATSVANPDFSAYVILDINPKMVNSIKISGNKTYLTKGETVTLNATVNPTDAEDKSIVWSVPTDSDVVSVDENGKVTALKQGSVNVRATNVASGVYAEETITVYDSTPVTVTAKVWVTNQSQNTSYTFNVPKNGEAVSVSSISVPALSGKQGTLVSYHQYRVGSWSNQPDWSKVQKTALVQAFKYEDGSLKYTTDGSTWMSVGSNSIYDFCNVQYKATSSDETDVKVTIGDWPFGDRESTGEKKNTIQITVMNSEDNDKEVYNSGTMRFSNNQNDALGKINFNCDASKYEVYKVVIKKGDTTQKTYNIDNGDKIPSDISCQFSSTSENHYYIQAYIRAKTIKVKYTSEGTVENMPENTTAKTTEQITVSSTAPTREGYIFTGWAYVADGTTTIYNGGDTLSASTSDVTLMARWVKESEQINYRASKGGSVTRSYERIVEGQSTALGSTATASSGYVFVKWVKVTDSGEKEVSTSATYVPTDLAPATYKAIFSETITSENVDTPSDHEYDGNDHKWSPTVTNSSGTTLTEGTDYTVTYSTNDFKNVTGTITVTIKGIGNYNGEVTRTYQITKRVVKLQSATDSKTYDGTYLTNSNVEYLEGTSFVSGEVKEVKGYGKVKDVSEGEVENTIQIIPEEENDSYNENNYDIQETLGKLSITPVTTEVVVKIKGNRGGHQYDGKQQTVSGYSVTEISNELYTSSDFNFSGNATVTATDAGTTWMGLKGQVDKFSNVSSNFTNVKFEVTNDGAVDITPASLTVTTPSAEKVYDGTPLTCTEGSSITGFVNGEYAELKVTGSQTEVGSSSNSYEILWNTTTKQGNYRFYNNSIGTLKVTKQSITPGADDYKGVTIDNPSDVTYNGLEQEWSPEVKDVSGNSLTKDADYTVSYSDDTKNVGTVKVTITGKGNYSGTVTREYKITKAPLTVVTAGAEKVYDGKALIKKDGYTFSGLVNNETAGFTVTGSQTKVGHSANTYQITWKADGNKYSAKSSNYEVTSETLGQLVVKESEQEIVVTTTGGTFTYDGQAHGATVSVGTLPEGYSVQTATSSATATDVTKEAVEATCDNLVILNAEGEDVTSKLTVTKVNGSIAIDPATLTVTTPNASKVYDDSALTAEGEVKGFVNGETATFTTTGSQTDVGSSSNTYSLVFDGTAKQSNYTVSENVGTLTVTEKDITPDTPDTPEEKKTGITVNDPASHVYDGKAHKETLTVTDTKTGKDLVEGKDYEVSYSTEDFTNVGTITITVKGVGNYTGEFSRSYMITPASVTVKANDASKVYGTNDPALKVDIEGLIGSDTVKYSVSRKSGEDVGTYDIVVRGETTQGNYTVEYLGATFTITSQSIDPDDKDAYAGVEVGTLKDVVYNGTEQKQVPSVTDKSGKVLSKSDYTVSYSDDVKNVGTVTVTITGQGNYSGTVTRTYKITPASVTVTADDSSKIYGAADPEFTAKTKGLYGSDTVTYEVSRDGGENVGTYAIHVIGEATQGNYTVKYVAGTFTITSKDITPDTPDTPEEKKTGITVNDPSNHTYDGKSHKETLTVKDTKTGNDLVEGKDYEVSYSTEDFTNVGTITITVKGVGNYTGEFSRSYKITPATVTVKANDASKVYGATDPKLTAEVSGLIGEDTIKYSVSRKSGEDVGEYAITASGKTSQGNYTVKYVDGTFTITSQSIDPSDDTYSGINVSDPSDVVYNGKIQAWKPVVTDKAGNEIAESMYNGWTVNYVDSDMINVGTITVEILGNGNYTGKLTKTYKITPASVVVTTESATKTYDGSALSASASLSGIVKGETYELHATGSQTEVGSSTNTYILEWNGTAKQSNYTITEKLGTLTVTQAATPSIPTTPVTPSTPSAPANRIVPNNNVTPSQQEETVEEDTTPKTQETEKVEKEETPKAKAKAYWALINLLAAILTVLFGLVLLLSKRHKDDEEDDDTEEMNTEDEDESEDAKKRGMISRVLAVLLGIGSVVFFLLTEDMRNLVTWTDKYTVWMVVLAVVQIVVFCVGRKWKDDSDEDEEENA